MVALRLIERKRDGGRIEAAEWRACLGAYVAGEVPDYQMAALLMASFLNGLDAGETGALMEAMVASGATLPPTSDGRVRVDKHSTGGVGDKVSLVLAPLVASLGVAVPMMSGRGLGHTGGTLDKLEAIPGFRVELTLEEAARQMERLGCVMMGQTVEIAPADRLLYALRHCTGTVESIPLIAASIMSKKLAEGLTGLALDVTRGSGAFLPGVEQGIELAQTMVRLGESHGCTVVALITAMDRPLGWACGSALETEEAIHALRGEGPPDLMEVTYALGAEMVVLGGVARTVEEARPMLAGSIASGAAARCFQAIIEAQGGNPGVVDDPAALPQAAVSDVFRAPRTGLVAQVEPRAIGRAVCLLGGGRSRVTDRIDPTVGFVIGVKPGDRVDAGQAVATIYARDAAGVAEGRATLERAIVIGDEPLLGLPLISHRVTAGGVLEYPFSF